ncbi:hypothetical protein DN820_08420 [Stutzerimonas nosocomialis]|uniref:Uncharacterized protein n=1 Tax=Stutzerimonas nosocomialis TaxID=1056496 RepID=A0A5R9QZ33_9GAMM|nr:hypothetical protein [Stutzerimonas nosocomialis]TLX64025.1 hypothetical protein DN820_08420 [Stutzerimonas nosocomialis]
MADTLYHAMICVCLGALLLACHSGYRLLAPPAPTDEMFGIYDGLIKKRVRTGKSSTVIYYIKLKDTPSLIRPDNDDRTIQRLKRTRYGSGLWITKKTKLSTPRASLPTIGQLRFIPTTRSTTTETPRRPIGDRPRGR